MSPSEKPSTSGLPLAILNGIEGSLPRKARPTKPVLISLAFSGTAACKTAEIAAGLISLISRRASIRPSFVDGDRAAHGDAAFACGQSEVC